MKLELSLIISQILAFLIMLAVLKKFAWKPLLTIMSERRERIESAFRNIEQERGEIERIKADYQQKLSEVEAAAKEKIAQAVDSGRKLALGIQEEAQAQAKAILQKAQEDIAYEIMKGEKTLKGRLINTVIETTEQFISTKLSGDEDRKLIGDLIDKI